MTIQDLKSRNDMLAYLLPTVKEILNDYLCYEEQKQMLEDFCINIVAFADAENSYLANMQRICTQKLQNIK